MQLSYHLATVPQATYQGSIYEKDKALNKILSTKAGVLLKDSKICYIKAESYNKISSMTLAIYNTKVSSFMDAISTLSPSITMGINIILEYTLLNLNDIHKWAHRRKISRISII